MMREHVVELRDGREVAVCEVGAQDNEAILEFHGNPGSRIVPLCSAEQACALGVRWVTFDRPGIGGSAVAQRRTVVDVVPEVEQICDLIEVGDMSVLGYSAGGPYAAACAYGLRSRVKALGLFAATPRLDPKGGMAVLGREAYWKLASRLPIASRGLYGTLGMLARRAPAVLERLMVDGCSAPERQVLSEPSRAARLVAVFAEATSRGSDGLIDDMRTLMTPWGFDPGDILTPTIVWQGDEDSFVGQAAGQWWADSLRGARLVALEGQGHFVSDRLLEGLVSGLLATSRGLAAAWEGGDGPSNEPRSET